MATGVFAWFVTSDGAKVGEFTGGMRSDMTLDIQIDQSEIFLGDRVRDLVYITEADFHTVGFDFYGLGSILELNLENTGSNPMQAKVGLNANAAPEYGIYAGVNGAFKYLIIDNPLSVTAKMWELQQSSNMFAAMQAHNAIGVTIPANTTKAVYVIIWGYYDGLPLAQKNIYHSIVYRMTINLIA